MEQELGAWDGEHNAGGIRRLKLIPTTDIISLFDPELHPDVLPYPFIAITNLELADNATILDLTFQRDTAVYSWVVDETPNGEIYTVSVTLEIPRLQQTLLGWFSLNRARRWVVLAEDLNGTCYLIGDPDNGAMLTGSATTGVRAGRNVQRLELQVKQKHTPWLLENLNHLIMLINKSVPLIRITAFRKERYDEEFAFKDTAGNPQDISAHTFYLDVFDRFNYIKLQLQEGSGLLKQNSNVLQAAITTAQMSSLLPGAYRMELYSLREGERDDFLHIAFTVL
ncbi:hypothetical protein [Arsenicibacter rosenii]|uniref:Uncharacterized protein n=1 Tax=Arsenicibacter rosenii TaxID=1750698 RepID=A0A1S2VRS3_9BACT|nr:hypothetical protein [Arsenicibacter rosenii]OIN61190.1 hypothetical protein BLX24_03780 [Arsenicibacter rosenii]